MRTNFSMENQNLVMVRGDTLSFNIRCINNMDEDIDFDKVFFTCKKNPNDEEIIFRKSLDDGITFEGGLYIIRAAPEDTQEVEIGKYYYDVRAEVGNDAYTLVRGTLTIEQNIS